MNCVRIPSGLPAVVRESVFFLIRRSLLTKREVKMAGCWYYSFIGVFKGLDSVTNDKHPKKKLANIQLIAHTTNYSVIYERPVRGQQKRVISNSLGPMKGKH